MAGLGYDGAHLSDKAVRDLDRALGAAAGGLVAGLLTAFFGGDVARLAHLRRHGPA
jgi:hypothetical protein